MEEAAGVFFDPKKRRRFSAQIRRHSWSSATCSEVTFRQCSSLAVSGLVTRDGDDPAGRPSLSPRSWIVQAATTNTGTAAVVTNIPRLNPARPLIGETSELLKAGSLDRMRESDEVAPCPGPGPQYAGRFRDFAPVPARQLQP